MALLTSGVSPSPRPPSGFGEGPGLRPVADRANSRRSCFSSILDSKASTAAELYCRSGEGSPFGDSARRSAGDPGGEDGVELWT
jgi:hypothetical protein